MRRVDKIQEWFFVLLVILLPTQLGKHFWPNWAYINGVRIDYFSPTLYLTDILVLFLFLLTIFNFRFVRFAKLLRSSIFNKFSNFKPQILDWRRLVSLGILSFGLLFIYINITHSLSPAVTIYKWIKTAEFGFLGFWIVKRLTLGLQSRVYLLLLIPIGLESILVVWQFFNQSSIGGIWYWLGERTFNASTPGIANAYINGSLVMRPYGTFPHPNVLGGFLAMFLPLLLARFLQDYRKYSAVDLSSVIRHLPLVILGLGYVALFLSMSRSAILVVIASSAVLIFLHVRRLKSYDLKFKVCAAAVLLVGAAGIGLVLPRFGALTVETESIAAREQFNNLAIEQWIHSPIFGKGLGTSPLFGLQPTAYRLLQNNYALAYQPVHNIYLLLLAESGIIGLGLFSIPVILAIKNLWNQRNYPLLTSLLSVLVLGLVDHYFLTVQQGQIILVMVVGMGLSRVKFS